MAFLLQLTRVKKKLQFKPLVLEGFFFRKCLFLLFVSRMNTERQNEEKNSEKTSLKKREKKNWTTEKKRKKKDEKIKFLKSIFISKERKSLWKKRKRKFPFPEKKKTLLLQVKVSFKKVFVNFWFWNRFSHQESKLVSKLSRKW